MICADGIFLPFTPQLCVVVVNHKKNRRYVTRTEDATATQKHFICRLMHDGLSLLFTFVITYIFLGN